ncbi:ribonuclease T2 family protein [Methylocystis sp. JAN1]|uniref:ribonuclease T2 family protein n=1 Tax=Methylocystis sp. JAN1 TaxID=3397211 RepID=UPI003FA1DD2A
MFANPVSAALRAGAICVAVLFFNPAQAKDDDCILDRCADRLPPKTQPAPAPQVQPEAKTEARESGGFRSGAPSSNFDFYVLALSWSPGFCDSVGGARDQCEPGRGHGFVVHGLWPQYEHGFPSDCDGPRSPSRIALERANGVFPDERLALYEWRKHGTCSGKSPSDYFADVSRAWEAVTIPAPFVRPTRDQTFTPIDIERAFYNANPRLRPGMMAVACRRDMLEEVRICLSKDLREFRVCPEVVRHGCRQREISVPAPL